MSRYPRLANLALLVTAVTVVAGCLLASPAVQAPAARVADLRSEHLVEPLGLGTPSPRLSWVMTSGRRGERQTAYRVLVASSPKLLEAGRGDLWDSGKVPSDRTLNVAYAGRALVPGQMCYWKVMAWDVQRRPTTWSRPARFSIGMLAQSDWTAKWIGMESANENECPWFRKSFDLDALPDTALASVGSLGFHELYVNGRKVSDAVLTPSVSDLHKRALYVTYDIRQYLRRGRNVVGLWLAPGWAQYVDHEVSVPFVAGKKPLAIAQVQIGGTRVVTDETWRCSLSTTRHIGAWTTGNFGGDRVDASKEVPGWCDARVDDSAWETAKTYECDRILSPDLVQPNRKCARIPATEIEPAGPGKWRVTMAEVFTGWIEVRLRGTPGSKVTVKVSSRLSPEVEFGQVCEYILGPTGAGTFCNRFSYHEPRYLTIEGLTEAPAPRDVVGYRISNDRARVGRFDCSNRLIKRIYDTTLNTVENLCTGGMSVDCPHRERRGYGGDGHTSLELALTTLDTHAFYSAWARDFCDIQESSGRILHTAPTIGGGGGPAWSGFILTMPWEVYLTYGDKQLLQRTYPHAKKWLAYIDAHIGDDGLLKPLPGGYWFFLGDWLAPRRSEGAETKEALLFNNCYVLYVLRMAAETASVLGQSDDARTYLRRAEALRAAINRRFLDRAKGAYLDTKQTHLVMPLIAGAVPGDAMALIGKSLEHEILVAENGHLDTGLHGTYFLTKYLTEQNRSDLLFTIASQTTYPSYGDLLDKGYTTWPEQWEPCDSIIHGCMNGIGGWFQRGLAGIRPDPAAPGYKRFSVIPAVVGDLTWAEASYESPYGRIVSEWRRSGNKLSLHVVVPPNTTATIRVPAAGAAGVTEGGRPAAAAEGVRALGLSGGTAVFEVGAGSYTFASTLPVGAKAR